MKIEQLEMIGYKTILVHWKRWADFSLDGKLAYLEEEINNVLNEDAVDIDRRLN